MLSSQNYIYSAMTSLLIFSSAMTAAADTNGADCPVLYGYNCVNGYYVDTSLPGGIYSFTPNSTVGLRAEAAAYTVREPKYACYGNGKFYAFDVDYNWWRGTSTTIMTVYDAQTWQQLDEHSWDDMVPQFGITYNPADGKIYTIMVDPENGFDDLIASINPVDYEITTVADLPWGLYFTTIFAGPDNRIYHLNSTDYRLYYTDLTTGQSYSIGEPQGFDCDDTRCAVYDFHQGGVAYFSCPDYEQTHIYRIDIETGEMTLCTTMPEHEYIAGMFIPEAEAEAPEAVSHLNIGQTDTVCPTVSLDMPNTTYGGKPLESDLVLLIDVDEEVTTIEAQAGEHVEWATSMNNGQHLIRVTVRNANGTSPERRLSTYVGADVPAAVENLTQTIDSLNSRVTLSWQAPTLSKFGGSIDPASLTYRVIRNPLDVVIADGLTECTITDQLPDAFAHYSYTVTPYSPMGEGESATTEEFAWGNAFVPPFTEGFENYDDYDRWTTQNLLEDELGWYLMMGVASTLHNDAADADYYLFSPAISLSADQTYTLAFTAHANGWSDLLACLCVGLATAPEADACSTLLLDTLSMRSYSNTEYFADFKIEQSGTYYLYFHDVTPASGSQATLEKLSLTINSALSAPDGVGQLKASYMEGGKGASISFTAPMTSADGQLLDMIDRIELSHQGEKDLLHTFDNPAPGEALSFDHGNAKDGRQTYMVTTYSHDQKGMTLHTSAYVGLDAPLSVRQLQAVQTEAGCVSLQWCTPIETGLNGGFVDVNNLSYNVYRMDDLDGYWTPVIGSNLSTLCFEDKNTNDALGSKRQTVVRYEVTANNKQGEGPRTSLLTNVGKAYPLTFKESFAAASYDTDGWYSLSNTGKGQWKAVDGAMLAVKPMFADGGMLQFANNSTLPSTATLYCPRVEIGQEAQHPMAVLYLYHGFEAEPEDLALDILVVANDGEAIQVTSLPYNDGTIGWQRHEIDLIDFVGSDNIRLRLKAYASDNSAALFVDNLSISDKVANDLELTHADFPAAVKAETPSMVTITVSNVGTEASSEAILRLQKDDEETDCTTIPSLNVGEAIALDLQMHNTLDDAYRQIGYQAILSYDADQHEANDASELTMVNIKGNTLPTLSLKGTTEGNIVSLEWNEPVATMAVPLTDDFEAYSPWASQGFGPWTTFDGDKEMTYWLRYWPSMGNHPYGELAYEVWNNQQAMNEGFFWTDEEFWPTHSGQTVLAAFTAIVDPITWDLPVENDNWIISPSIVGGTDVSFWINKVSSYNNEYFELLYSEQPALEAPDAADFMLLRRDSLMGDEGWKLISATLPREAIYFAIRHCTVTNGYVALLDDVTYTPDEGSEQAINRQGYNIYRDGERIATTEQCSYVDGEALDGTHTYAVTSCWAEGESMLSNRYITDVVQGIDYIEASETQDACLYNMAGIRIWSGKNHDCEPKIGNGIYLLNSKQQGRKIIVK